MITIDNLAFSYGSIPVLKNITTRLEEGRIYGLLGENDSADLAVRTEETACGQHQHRR